ncbi:Ankyrin [Fimbriimonas ginsengisoli Gsoil 348]|uniref:Ankyrin n=2 Tax=Fimbriimonas ginsengisoli TaxID=1005039 RepID=A0A068NP81_FIMGI|nr:Ankyrin [Fimbriimonas ginsengisoli Gsoil 348]
MVTAFIACVVCRHAQWKTPFLIASVKRHDVDAVRELLRAGADPNGTELLRAKISLADGVEGGKLYPGNTTLIIATAQGAFAIVRLLLQCGAHINGVGLNGEIPLNAAIYRGDRKLVRYLLDRGADIRHADAGGNQPLSGAAAGSDPSMIALLLDRGAPINGTSGDTPLAMAAWQGKPSVVRLLLSRGADPNFRRPGHQLPLEMASNVLNTLNADLLRRAGGKSRSRKERWSESLRESNSPNRKSKAAPSDYRPEDAEVLDTVLTDLCSYGDEKVRPRGPASVLVGDANLDIDESFADSQINSELDLEHANEISLEMRRSLVNRNASSAPMSGYRPADPRVDLNHVNSQGRFQRPYPGRAEGWRAWVHITLPGYSHSHDSAVVLVTFPNFHMNTGTYLLTKRDGRWSVKWRALTHFA